MSKNVSLSAIEQAKHAFENKNLHRPTAIVMNPGDVQRLINSIPTLRGSSIHDKIMVAHMNVILGHGVKEGEWYLR